jgi:NO-binding membrane sensor protein with MHYT domain/nitrogen-specific signal transduction histidine kinase
MCVSGPGGVVTVFDWDVRLIVLSVAVAIAGSFAALEFAGRIRVATESGLRRHRFSIAGAALMGLAIWTMHFVGMLALKMPMPISYSVPWSLLSMLAAAIGAGLAFLIMNQPRVGWFHVTLGGVAMGLAIASMHYLGMKSMRLGAVIDYEPLRFFASVSIAVIASAAALALGYWIPSAGRWAYTVKTGSAIVMGIAIAGMHYMGMAAARYTAAGVAVPAVDRPMVGAFPLGDFVAIASIVFGGALIALTARSAIDRQRALDAYRLLASELEERVRERTAELEAANQELSAFTYTVSHDLRSPLRTISGFVDVLYESHRPEFSAETLGHLDRIRKASVRMDALLSGLLNLANIARTALQRTEVDLSQLARSILADLASDEPTRRVETKVADHLTACGDPTLLTSALQNLLHNAWKFTSKSAASRIEFGAKGYEGKTVFFVRDTGAGFDMAHVKKLFGMFERLHPVTEFAGHGIGLAVTRRIIERHGGMIWAESVPEQGATFYFTLG